MFLMSLVHKHKERKKKTLCERGMKRARRMEKRNLLKRKEN
jgi:hypothetical protein